MQREAKTVIDELDGHHKVLQFYDTSNSGRGIASTIWDNSYSSGFIEVWLRMSSTAGEGYFSICDGSISHAIRFRFDNTGYNDGKI